MKERELPPGRKKKIPSTSGQSLSCLSHESFSLANNEFSFFSYPRVLQFAFSLIEKISKVVYYTYPLIGTPSNDLYILLSFPVGRSIHPI